MSVSGRRTLKKYHYLQSTSAVHHVVLGCGERVGAQQAQDSFQSVDSSGSRSKYFAVSTNQGTQQCSAPPSHKCWRRLQYKVLVYYACSQDRQRYVKSEDWIQMPNPHRVGGYWCLCFSFSRAPRAEQQFTIPYNRAAMSPCPSAILRSLTLSEKKSLAGLVAVSACFL